MTIRFKKESIETVTTPVLVLPWFSGGKTQPAETMLVDKHLGQMLSRYAEEEHFEGKAAQTLLIRTDGKIGAARVILLGMGEKKKLTPEIVRQAAGTAMNCLKGAKTASATIIFFGKGKTQFESYATAMVEGLLLASYAFGRYKKEEGVPPEEVTIALADAALVRLAEKIRPRAEALARATIFARDLVNTPGAHLSPKELVEETRKLVEGVPQVEMEVFDKAQLTEMGAGGLLGVAQGSDHEPYLVHLTYKPKKASKQRIALVGKAITFDSGGLSLKPTKYMLSMKCDMAGAAAVIGLFSIINELSPTVEVHGYFGACENMPSGKALRPGDVVTAMNGKTIEIHDTDAEGRVTLADVLTFALKSEPTAIIDLATLTGACLVALGEEVVGVMGNDQKLIKMVMDSAQATGEKMWQLPLEEAYKRDLKSEIADYKNLGSPWGGSVTAGLFLQEFVGGKPWAHLDIAGPAFAEKPINSYMKHGGTGWGVRTLAEVLRRI
ncbi:leucyl aminopeptidase [Candidatus Uhrbacteria bacterium]|nr:leucyl aminopeptidase [Candidatus Uhrbacteria bacterium]